MDIITYRPQLKEVDSSVMKTDKNYVNFLRNTNPEISLISKTDKKFIENLAKFLQLESNVSLNTKSIKEFVKSLFSAKIFVESKKKTPKKSGIGGRVSIDKKVERITKMRELDKRFDERDAEMTKSGKIPIKKEIEYRLLAMQRREKRRNEGLIPKTFSEERERKFPKTKKG